jgi:hypothetical protein
MDATVPTVKKLELRSVLDKLKTNGGGRREDVGGMDRDQESSAQVWAIGRPALDVLIGEGVKKLLGF